MNYYPGRNGFQGGFNQQQGYAQQQQNGRRQYKDNQGKVWRNMKATKPNSPHFTGAGTFNGVECFISVWLGSHPQKGDEISIKVTPKQEQRREQFQSSPTYNGFPQPPAQGHTYSFAPSNQPQQPYNSGPQFGHPQPQPQQPYPQPQPAGNNAPPPANGPADYGMAGYPNDDSEDFPGF
jgi:hypothetical protein